MSIPRRNNLEGTFSAARAAFADNCDDIRSYYTIHQYGVKQSDTLKKHIPVLDKAMFVLIASLWESYCEDIATEVLSLLACHCESPELLPKQIRQQVAKDILEDKNNLAAWSLAGDGWRDKLRTRSSDWARQRDWRFNSPKSVNVDAHFKQALGIERISDCWKIGDNPPATTREALDSFMAQRGSIAHRSEKAPINKRQVKSFVNLIIQLVYLVDKELERYLLASTSLASWPTLTGESADICD